MRVRKPTEEQMAELMAWRSLALDQMPYFAAVLFSLRVLDAPGLGTFACDAQHRLYVDFDGVAGWTPTLKSEALLHECMHLYADHAGRATDAAVQDYERGDWNVVSDAEINDDLRDAGCAELAAMGVLAAKIGCDDYETAERYMAVLRKRRQQHPQPQQGGQNAGRSEKGNAKPYTGCGSGSGGQPAPGELGADDDLDGAASPASAIERERVRISTSASVREHAAKSRGTVPGGLVEIADQVLAPPKVPWQRTLAAAVRRGVGARVGADDSSYSRRNRRTPTVAYGDGRVIRPGLFSPLPTLALVRDTSGSMSEDDLSMVTNEIDGIARPIGIRGRDLKVYDVDADVGSIVDYNGARSIAQITGRGGTDMRVGIDAALRQRPLPNAVVVLSDGYTPWPIERPAVPLIICLIPNSPDAEMSNLLESCPDWAVTVVAQD